MKKIIAYLLVALMCVSGLAACGNDKVSEELQAAVDYIYAMYKDAGTVTATDFERTTQVMIGGVAYPVEWTADTDKVTITVDGNVAKIDVDEKSPEEVQYTLTATVKDADGKTAKKEFKYSVPKYEGLEKIVKDAYALESGATLEGTFTLEGVIVSVDTPYSADYKNVTVTIQVGTLVDMPIMCYRLAGEGADTIKMGDTITVTGSLTNYNGTIEFAQGCTLDKVVVGEDTTPEPPTVPEGATMEEIVDLAYTLISGIKFTEEQTLTGVITSVDTAYDEGYKNVTVTIQVGDKADKLIKCYRMKGDGADKIAVGDTITVTGILTNYSGSIQFDAGCTLDSYTSNGGSNTGNSGNTGNTGNSGNSGNTGNSGNSGNTGNSGNSGNTGNSGSSSSTSSSAKDIMNAAEKLADGETLEGEYQLSGVVTSIVEGSWSSQYGNMHFTMKVDGADGKTIYCYGVDCDENNQFIAGDKVTLKGTIKNYKGTIELYLPELISRTNTTRPSGSGSTNTATDLDVPANASQKQIVDLAYSLANGKKLTSEVTLTGTVKEINKTGEAGEICLTYTVEGKDIYCYWLKGEGAESLKPGDVITVKGPIKNYNGTIEFDKGQLQ